MEGDQERVAQFFFQNSVFALGDGRRINVWKDVWCGGEALCARFPSLFNLAMNKEAKVADIWDSGDGVGGWSPTFLRSLNDWEIGEMVRFPQILHDQNFRPTGEDMLLLKEVKAKVSQLRPCIKVTISPPPLISLIVRFGIQSYLKKLASLLGKLHGAKCSRWIISNAEE